MDFKQLESFVAIGRLKSFSRAAERLFLTQPTLSNHIARLEEELGLILFERGHKKTELTAAGQTFFLTAVELLNLREAALVDLAGFSGRIEGLLEIGASSVPAHYVLPPLLARFAAQYPGVSYNLRSLNSARVIAAILAGEMDFGLVGSAPAHNQLAYEQLATDELAVIAPPLPPFSAMADISLEQLLREGLILRPEGSGTRQAFERALEERWPDHPPLNIRAYMDDEETISRAVTAGLGLAVVSRLAAADKARLGQLTLLVPRDFEIKRPLWFVCPRDRLLSPLAARFRDFVLNESL